MAGSIASGRVTDFPAVTSDYYPTILDFLELSVPGQKPLDGISLRPVIAGTATTRTSPIGFKIESKKSWVNHQYKLLDKGGGWLLYDLINIPPGEEVEQTPIATAANIASKPQAIQHVFNTMLAEYTAWKRRRLGQSLHPSLAAHGHAANTAGHGRWAVHCDGHLQRGHLAVACRRVCRGERHGLGSQRQRIRLDGHDHSFLARAGDGVAAGSGGDRCGWQPERRLQHPGDKSRRIGPRVHHLQWRPEHGRDPIRFEPGQHRLLPRHGHPRCF
jgi:hypothetical protein